MKRLLPIHLALLLATTALADPVAITLDGEFVDWPDGVKSAADSQWIYIRHDIDRAMSLQAAPVMTALQFDLDADSATGQASGDGWGVDLEVTLTPLDHRDPTRLGAGMAVDAFGPGADHHALAHADLGIAFLPTHASTSFEFRIARRVDGPGWLRDLMRSTENIRYRFVERNARYQTLRTDAAQSIELPPIGAGERRFDARVPIRDADTLRIVSWNVLWGAPMKTPDGFARVLKSLNADVILFQEWDTGYWTDEPRIPESEQVAWLETHVGDDWSVRRCEQRGVLVASRHAIAPFLPERIDIPGERLGERRDRGVRCASARVNTPLGEVGAVSVHFKSRGGLNSQEDVIRLAEVEAMLGEIERAVADSRPDFLVIGGDWNLVGGRKPLEFGVAGTDLDGSDMRIVEPRRLGIADAFTWREARAPFSPGRLDYVVISDADVEVVRSFILDASILSDSALSDAHLRRTDTDASDHLPLVVDLRRTSDR